MVINGNKRIKVKKSRKVVWGNSCAEHTIAAHGDKACAIK